MNWKPGQSLPGAIEQCIPGDATARDALVNEVYDELRRIAKRELDRRAGCLSLQPTEVVHEAYLRLHGQQNLERYSRAQLVSIGAIMIRRVLVDGVRERRALKRGGDRRRHTLASSIALAEAPQVDLMDLDEALERLAAHRQRWVRVVEMRYFGGLSCREIAALVGRGEEAVRNDWRMARAWLHRELGKGCSS